jgi:hypothetical protein
MKLEPLNARIPALAKDAARALIVRWDQGDLPADQYVLVEHYDAAPGGAAAVAVLGVVRASTREHVATLRIALDEPGPGGVGAASALLPDAPQSSLAPAILDLFRETLGTETRYLRSLRQHAAAFRATLGAVEPDTKPEPKPAPKPSAVSRAYPPRNNGRRYP